MTQPSYTITRVCLKHLRQVFWRERLWEKYFMGELNITFKTPKPVPKPFRDRTNTLVLWSQDLRFTDPANGDKEVVRAHWHLDAKYNPAASGMPDPKDIMLGNENFRKWRFGDTACPMCPFTTRSIVTIGNVFLRIWNRAQSKNSCHDESMKPHPEMIEGPEALSRFENTMRALFSNRKSDVLPQKPKAQKAKQRKKSSKPRG